MLTAENISVSERTRAILNCHAMTINLKSEIVDAVETLAPDEDAVALEVSVAFDNVEAVIDKYLNLSIHNNLSTLDSTEI